MKKKLLVKVATLCGTEYAIKTGATSARFVRRAEIRR
jgi:hypothetical protein